MQSGSYSYAGQPSPHASLPLGSSAGSMAVSGSLQFSNGLQMPQAAGAGGWQQQQQQQHLPMTYSIPTTPSMNPPPYLRQGHAAALGISSGGSSQQFQKLELPPLPRQISSSAPALEHASDAASEFKPAVFAVYLRPLSERVSIRVTPRPQLLCQRRRYAHRSCRPPCKRG
jgi:hypothetical protein